MEQETMLKEILNALKVHGEKIDQRFDKMETEMKEGFESVDRRFEQVDRRFEQVDRRFEQMDRRFEQVDRRFEQVDARFEQVDHRFERIEEQLDHHGKKSNGLRADFHETQENVDYLLIKNAQHEGKLHEFSKRY